MTINRRQTLKLLSAFAVAGCQSTSSDARGLRVVVAGAGIVGASIAYHLAQRGASVCVIDSAGPATHASRGTFAWINATWAKQPRDYHALNQASVEYWKTLQATLDIPMRWEGSLEWFSTEERQAKLATQIAEQVEWGEPARMVGAQELNAMEPNVDFGSATSAAFSPNDGALDPVLATNALLEAAKTHGAEVRYPCQLHDINTANDRLREVITSQGPISADKLVLATGAATEVIRQVADIDLPQRSTPGVIAVTEPIPPLINAIIVAPGIHVHQRLDGRVVLGEQDGPPNTDQHAARLQGRPNAFPTRALALEHAQRMMAIAQRFIPALSTAVVEGVFIGWRPLPIDGHPVLGFSPKQRDTYIAVMHSGVTLAPIAGRFAADELLTNASTEALTGYRPTRDFSIVRRY
ncbi:MAG: FAD-dependent oxidoreductase [Pseudomonadota bacterium]